MHPDWLKYKVRFSVSPIVRCNIWATIQKAIENAKSQVIGCSICEDTVVENRKISATQDWPKIGQSSNILLLSRGIGIRKFILTFQPTALAYQIYDRIISQSILQTTYFLHLRKNLGDFRPLCDVIKLSS